MGRKPIGEKPMTSTERSRRQRQLKASAADRAQFVLRAFEFLGADAQALFIKWLRKMKLIE